MKKTSILPILMIFTLLGSLSSCKKEEEEMEEGDDPQGSGETGCLAPEDLTTFTVLFGRYHLSWEPAGNGDEIDFYEIEYGVMGFEQGTGLTKTLNGTSTFELVLEGGEIYQFYVRAFCTDGEGWSDWAGPHATVVDQDQYLCTPPSNVSWLIQENGIGEPTGALFDWERNGEYHHEMTISLDGQPIDESNLFSLENEGGSPYFPLTQNTNYDFWIRAVCLDDTRTDWVGPTNVNIGD